MAEPGGRVSYQQKYVRCGKPGCRRCAEGPGHGPYWYAYWREGDRIRSRYLGKAQPPGVAMEAEEAAGAAEQKAPAVPQSQRAPGGRAGRKGTMQAPGTEMAPWAQRRRTSGDGRVAVSLPQLRIWTLGQFRVVSAGVPVPYGAWRRKSATVLKLLLLADNRRLPREHIAAYLWPDADEEAARNQLAAAVHALRRALEPGLAAGEQSRYVRQEGANLVLSLGPADSVDYLDFEALLAEGAAATDPLPYLEQVATLYGGDLMPEEESAWCVAAREALRLRWHGALLALAEAQAGHRQFDGAAATLSRLLSADPTNEEAARRLMGLLGRQGRRAEALRLYGRLEQALRDELATEPAPETEAIAQALRAGAAPPTRRRTQPAEPSREVPAAVGPASSVLVGRTSEMARLRAALLAAREGQGQALLLAGTAGIGKTRLVVEVSTNATMLGFTVLGGRAAESEQDLPYAPIAEALHLYTHTRPPGALRRDLAGAEAVRELVPDLAGMLPGLAEPPPLENVGATRLRLWMAVRSLLAAAAASRPVLVTLEDLHWADEASLGLLSFLVRRTREQRLMVLGTLRDDDLAEGHPLHHLLREGQREGTVEVLQVSGLSLEEVGALALGQLGAPLSAAHVAALCAQCGGNPLFINELLALLRKSRQEADVGSALGAVLTGSRALPSTIRQTLSQRSSRVSAPCRALLQISAVIGDRSSIDLLRGVAGLEPAVFDAALEEAVTAGLLREDELGDGRECALAHALLRRVLYDALSPSQRQRLHARVGGALADLAFRGRGPQAIVIAHHYAQSDDPATAGSWLERAGDHAAGVHAVASALAHYGKALDLLETAVPPRDSEEGRAEARLHEKVGDLLLLEGDYAAAADHFARARSAVDDQVQRAELWRKEAITWEKRGDFARALAALATAEQGTVSQVGALGDRRDDAPALPAVVQAEVALSRGDVYWSQGDFEAAAMAAERALAVLEGGPEGPSLARATHLLGRVAGVRGDYLRADACYRGSLAIRERIGDWQGIAACWYGLGLVAYDRGDLAEAEACHRRSLAIRERIGDQWGSALSWGKLAQLAQYQGNYALTEACNRRSLTLREQIGSQPGIAGAAYQLGQVACDHGDYAGAAAHIERGLRIQELIGDQWGCSNSLTDLGDVARERGDFTLAEQYYRRSLGMKERLGDQLGMAGCLHRLGLLAGEWGDQRTAQSLGRQARRLARRIGARGMEASASLGQASAALAAGRVQLAAVLIRYSRALAADNGSARTMVQVILAEAALDRDLHRLPEATAAARDALRLAVRGQFRREEALAQRMLGSCALAAGDTAVAMPLLRSACSLLEQIGASAELARTQTTLSELRAQGGHLYGPALS